jgi:hypothetical protein
MVYVITDLNMVENYGRFKADSARDALEEFAHSNGFLNLTEFASLRPSFVDALMAVQLQ